MLGIVWYAMICWQISSKAVTCYLRQGVFSSSTAVWKRNKSILRSSSNDNNAAPVALIFDTETTGKMAFNKGSTDPVQPDVIQLGLLLVDTSDWSKKLQISMLVQLREGACIEKGAFETHGISKEDCSKFGVSPRAALNIFNDACARADILVAHNLNFDEKVMQTALYREKLLDASQLMLPEMKRLCTMELSTNILKLRNPYKKNSFKWPKLEEAYKKFSGGKELKGGHDALVDAEACLVVLQGLVENGHVSLGQSSVADDDHTTIPEMSLHKLIDGRYQLKGKTYEHRNTIRSMGATWNKKDKAWEFHDSDILLKIKEFARVSDCDIIITNDDEQVSLDA